MSSKRQQNGNELGDQYDDKDRSRCTEIRQVGLSLPVLGIGLCGQAGCSHGMLRGLYLPEPAVRAMLVAGFLNLFLQIGARLHCFVVAQINAFTRIVFAIQAA